MRNYLFLLLAIVHIVACSQEGLGMRSDPHSHMGRREMMEERIEEKFQKHEAKDPKQDLNHNNQEAL